MPCLWLGACRDTGDSLNIYWGDVHGHSALSDGTGTPAEYFSYARDTAQLDFTILTDHDFGNGPPWRLSLEDWESIRHEANQFTADGRFVAIAGYEWTSQPKYWKEYKGSAVSENLFDGPVRDYGHKCVYFPDRVKDIFRSKDEPYSTPRLLTDAVREIGGLIHTCHPGGDETAAMDQWDFDTADTDVIANCEIGPDVIRYEGTSYETNTERRVIHYLQTGGRCGFVAGSDTHEGKPAARTAILAEGLSREQVFDALRRRRVYAVSNAPIRLDFRINDASMGEEITTDGTAFLFVAVSGTEPLAAVTVFRNGEAWREFRPGTKSVRYHLRDDSLTEETVFYFVRVTQNDTDAHGNPSRAWSSPIWVTRR